MKVPSIQGGVPESCITIGRGADMSYRLFGAGAELGGGVQSQEVIGLGLPLFSEVGERSGSSATPVQLRSAKTVGAGRTESVDTAPFILSEALPVVPAKLVKKIRNGEYIDMAELLKDNIELERRRAATEGEGSRSSFLTHRTGRRELPDIMSWLHCFSLFAAVVSAEYPEKARDLWAYQAIMIGEHRRCGGRGWQMYDACFRQQLTSLQGAEFGKLNQSLYSTTFLAYRGRGQSCPTCLLSDHLPEECALHPDRAMPVVRLTDRTGAGEWRARSPERRGRSSERRDQEPGRKRQRKGACFLWNDGKCSSARCRFDHVCSRCFGNHRRPACRARPEEAGRGREDTRRPREA